jgi:hypothetical protein
MTGKGDKLQKRLSAYSALAAGVLAVVPSAEAAIQHSGVQNLTVNSSTTPVFVDMDGDSNNDFEFTHTTNMYSAQSGLGLNALGGASVIIMSDTGHSDWANLAANYSIRSNINSPLSWEDGWEPLAGYYYTSGSFNSNGVQGYLGVRFTSSTCNNGNFHYGWIQWRTDNSTTQGTVVDWAYETTCNTRILAGAGQQAVAVPAMDRWGLIALISAIFIVAARMFKKQES